MSFPIVRSSVTKSATCQRQHITVGFTKVFAKYHSWDIRNTTHSENKEHIRHPSPTRTSGPKRCQNGKRLIYPTSGNSPALLLLLPTTSPSSPIALGRKVDTRNSNGRLICPLHLRRLDHSTSCAKISPVARLCMLWMSLWFSGAVGSVLKASILRRTKPSPARCCGAAKSNRSGPGALGLRARMRGTSRRTRLRACGSSWLSKCA